MASRVVRDGYLSSSTIHAMSPGAQDRFPRYLMLADYFGCFECLPDLVRPAIYAQRPDMTVERVRADLLEYAVEMLEVWTDNGRIYGFWRKWGRHNSMGKEDAYRRKTPVPPSVRPYGTLKAYYEAGADTTAPHPRREAVVRMFDQSPRQLTLISAPPPVSQITTARQLPVSGSVQLQLQDQPPAAADAAGVRLSAPSDTPRDTLDGTPDDTLALAANTPSDTPPNTPPATPEHPEGRQQKQQESRERLGRRRTHENDPHVMAFRRERYEVYGSAYRHKYREDPPPDGAGRSELGRACDDWTDSITALDEALEAYVGEKDRWYGDRRHALRYFRKWLAEGRHRRVSAAATPRLNPAEIIACPTPGCGKRTMRQNFLQGTCPDCWLAKRDRQSERAPVGRSA